MAGKQGTQSFQVAWLMLAGTSLLQLEGEHMGGGKKNGAPSESTM